MKKSLEIIIWILLILLLTALSQIGGVVLLFSLLFHKVWKVKFRFKLFVIFIIFYFISIFFIIPPIATIFGRERIKHSHKIQAANYVTVLLNRNYVNKELNEFLKATEERLSDTEIGIVYLDANFPFVDGFPLPPHLSHNDGKKIDFSFVYEDQAGKIRQETKSLSGYGVFEPPKKGEQNQVQICLNAGHFQYDFPKYFKFTEINKKLRFSESGTKKLIQALLKSPKLEKLFIEPHIKQRLKLSHSKIRYHGCYSVRHDDHIHIQIK